MEEKVKNELESLFKNLGKLDRELSEKDGSYVDPRMQKLTIEKIKTIDKIKEKIKKEKNRMKGNHKIIEVCLGVGMDQFFPSYQRIVIEEESQDLSEMEKKLKKSINKKPKKSRRLSLINYEGDCIWTERTKNGEFKINDQYGKTLDTIKEPKFYEWMEGTICFEDSKGKKWFYTKEHKDSKPTKKTIINFLKGD